MSRPVYVVFPYVHRGVVERDRAYWFVAARWRDALPTAEALVVGEEPFSWAGALNSAIRDLPDDAIVVHSDPDSYVMPHQALAAVGMADAEPGLVVAFDEYLYLPQSWTRRIIAGLADPFVAPPTVDARGEKGVGNVTVYRRSTWEAAGGYDERFDGAWGGADACFAYATASLVAPVRRIPGPMFHLWHPRLPESEPGGPGYAEQFALVAEYRDAVDEAAIRRILDARATTSREGAE